MVAQRHQPHLRRVEAVGGQRAQRASLVLPGGDVLGAAAEGLVDAPLEGGGDRPEVVAAGQGHHVLQPQVTAAALDRALVVPLAGPAATLADRNQVMS